MRILVSAYACNPTKGSEPGLGWNWVCALARQGHEVLVLTQAKNRADIEQREVPTNLSFVYLPSFHIVTTLRKCFPFIPWIFYYLWQCHALLAARKRLRTEQFDYAHHLTFATFRCPSFLPLLDIPTVVGPIGGGENPPAQLYQHFPVKERLWEKIRVLGNTGFRLSPLSGCVLRKCIVVFYRNNETLQHLPLTLRPICIQEVGVGFDRSRFQSPERRKNIAKQQAKTSLRFLSVGQLQHLKGFHLCLRAFALVLKSSPSSTLTIVGDGPARDHLHDLSQQLGIHSSVRWTGHLNASELSEQYLSNDVFIFPSIHDSAGMAVVEALAYGLPTICLDIGGPPNIIDQHCGIILPVAQKTENEIVTALAKTMLELSDNRLLLDTLADGALRRAEFFDWDQIIVRTTEDISRALCSKHKQKLEK